MRRVTGGDTPAAVWRSFMIEAHRGIAVRDFDWLGPAPHANEAPPQDSRGGFYQDLTAEFSRTVEVYAPSEPSGGYAKDLPSLPYVDETPDARRPYVDEVSAERERELANWRRPRVVHGAASTGLVSQGCDTRDVGDGKMRLLSYPTKYAISGFDLEVVEYIPNEL